MRTNKKCQGIRFENLPYLLKDLRENGWIIDVFIFTIRKENILLY